MRALTVQKLQRQFDSKKNDWERILHTFKKFLASKRARFYSRPTFSLVGLNEIQRHIIIEWLQGEVTIHWLPKCFYVLI